MWPAARSTLLALSHSREVGRSDRLDQACGRSRPEAGIASRLGQPAARSSPAQRAGRSHGHAAVPRKRPCSPMADSPPQRIHALLSATPGPGRPSPSRYRGFGTAGDRNNAARAAGAASWRPGIAESKTWMFCARVGAGRAWMACAACRASTRARGALRRAGPRSGPDRAKSDPRSAGRGVGPKPDTWRLLAIASSSRLEDAKESPGRAGAWGPEDRRG